MTDRSSHFNSRDDALAFLLGRIDFERTRDLPYTEEAFKLDRMRDLLSRLGDPHDGMKIVHVAGTKGKGSTATLIAAMLTSAGYKTGIFTSPHLERIEERASIDGKPCTADDFVELLSLIRPIVQQLDDEVAAGRMMRGPTFFEITTAMSLLHFRRSQVDFAILEVGLGGRLDSTNVCNPMVSVITSISYDHTKQLGETLAEIAAEKAGIIKPAVPIVSGVTNGEPAEVIERIALENKSDLYRLGEHFFYENRRHSLTTHELAAWQQPEADGGIQQIDFVEQLGDEPTQIENIGVRMLGQHQAANAAIAIMTIRCLQMQGCAIPDAVFHVAPLQTTCPARMEVISVAPTVLIDSAHNVASIEALISTLNECFPEKRRLLIFATSQDKDAKQMLKLLAQSFDELILTRYTTNPRSVAPDELLSLCKSTRAIVLEDPHEAWRHAHSQAAPTDLICVAGSSFIAGELRTLALGEDRQKVVPSQSLC